MENNDTKTKTTPNISRHGSFPESPYTVELCSKQIHAHAEHRQVEIDGVPHGIYELPKGKIIPVDPALYTKMFKGNYTVLMNLPEPAARMLYYIIEYIKVNSDQVCILKEDYLKFAGYKPTGSLTYYRALDGLMEAKIIAKIAGNTTCYWVNPNVLFNGDRTKLKNIIINSPKDSFSLTQNRNNY